MMTSLLTDLLFAVLPILAWTLGLALALFAGVVLLFRPFVLADRQAVAEFAARAAAARQTEPRRGESVFVRLDGRLIRLEVV